MDSSSGFQTQLGFVDLLIVLILWTLLVPPWQLFITNLFYKTWNLDAASTWDTGIVAAAMTTVFFIFITTFRNILAMAAGYDVVTPAV